MVLGSGLGDFAESLVDAVAVPYGDIPHWPVSSVVGHAGRLVVGTVAGPVGSTVAGAGAGTVAGPVVSTVAGTRVVALSGRAHLYEGHDIGAVVFATRVMAVLGVRQLILTNAAGGLNTSFTSGALMVIDDHINLMGGSPLIGPNDDRLGPRFPDMSEVYSVRLRRIANETAKAKGVALVHGVYVAVPGPSYETPAEVRYLRAIGADAVGMSTVPEAIAARHMGVEVLGISCITNMAAGVLAQPIVHDEVLETARRVRGSVTALLEGILERL